jgi:hypothetical protein
MVDFKASCYQDAFFFDSTSDSEAIHILCDKDKSIGFHLTHLQVKSWMYDRIESSITL